MTRQHFTTAAEQVRDILEGRWTHDAPDWADRERYECIDTGEPDYIRAVQTAEAYILLFKAFNPLFDEARFLRACTLA